MAALPRHWVEAFDDAHQRTYFFHTLTRRSTWTRPVDEDQDAPPSLTARASGDWMEVYSAEHDRVYYYNRTTRQSVWTDPRLAESPARPAGRVVLQPASAQRSEPPLTATWDAPRPTNGGDATLSYASIGGSFGRPGSSGQQQPYSSPPLFSSPQQQQQQQQQQPPLSPNPLFSSLSQSGNPAMFASSPGPVTGLGGFSKSPQSFSPNSRSGGVGGGGGGSSIGLGSGGAEILEDELEMYTRDLYRQSQAMSEQSRSWTGSDRAQVDQQASSLAETAANLLKGKPKKRALDEFTLATWGDQPPTVIEVKRRAKGVQKDLEYVKEEMKAQSEAKAEAVAADAEGGYYTILGVPTNADAAMLKKAFRQGMIKNHPDKVSDADRAAAQEKANMLQSAYNCLSSPWERFLYDWLGLKRYLYHVKVIQSFKNYMLTGFPVIKHPRKGYPRTRVMWISPDWQFLQTAPERILEPTDADLKTIKGLRLTDIHDVVRGITTEVFERTGKPKQQSKYFSIITSDRTLDIECESKERCDFLFSRISMLVFDTQQNRKWAERFFEVEALQKARAAAAAAKAGGRPPPQGAPPPPEASKPPSEQPKQSEAAQDDTANN